VLVFKVRAEIDVGGNVKSTLFVGEKGYALQNAGTFVLRLQEWMVLGSLLMAGQSALNDMHLVQANLPKVEVVLTEEA
jgi:hypothetical protein